MGAQQQKTTLSDMQKSRHMGSDNNSTGVAFFGGASSSGGGGVQGIQHSAKGRSPQGMITTAGALYQAATAGNVYEDFLDDDSSGAAALKGYGRGKYLSPNRGRGSY